MAAQGMYDEDAQGGGMGRREFIGSATLTAAGAVAGLSWYFGYQKPKKTWPDLAAYLKPENQVRMGYIGVGNRGGSLLRSTLQAPGCYPVAVADIRESQRSEFLDRMRNEWRPGGLPRKVAAGAPGAPPNAPLDPPAPEVKAYADYRQLLDDKSIEAVIIATPHYLHGPMAMDAIEAGKHVYCEKAMAYTIAENQDLVRLARQNPKLVFQVGHQRRYSQLYQKVKELIESGAIGDIAMIRAQWNQNQVERRPCPDPALEKVINWRLYSDFSGGLTTEFASHQVDVANWLIGTHPDSVCGFGGVDWYHDGRDTADNVHLLFNYKVPVPGQKDASGNPLHRGVKLTYTSMMQNAFLGPSELILGTKGTIEVCLSGGAEMWKEPKAIAEEEAAAALAAAEAAGKAGKPAPRKAVKAGATIVPSCLKRKKGDLVEVKDRLENRWQKFTTPLEGAYDTGETFLAVGAFLETVIARRAGDEKRAAELLKADVNVGLEGAVPCLMANMAMRENRTVEWSEFFPDDGA